MRKIHYTSGLTISIFVVVHLVNHLYSLFGEHAHIELMNELRVVYRHVIAESILLLAVLVQIVSGIQLVFKKRKSTFDIFGKLQLWTGLYLAFFLFIHVTAVLSGRLFLKLDTNLYFGVAGLNTFPWNVFFMPYYGLAIVSFFGHLAVVHSKKMKTNLFGIEPMKQAYGILIIGVILSFVILYGLTNGFSGVDIPKEYNVLIGK